MIQYDLNPSKLTPADLTDNTVKRIKAGVDIKLHYFSIIPLSLQNKTVIKVPIFNDVLTSQNIKIEFSLVFLHSKTTFKVKPKMNITE